MYKHSELKSGLMLKYDCSNLPAVLLWSPDPLGAQDLPQLAVPLVSTTLITLVEISESMGPWNQQKDKEISQVFHTDHLNYSCIHGKNEERQVKEESEWKN